MERDGVFSKSVKQLLPALADLESLHPDQNEGKAKDFTSPKQQLLRAFLN